MQTEDARQLAEKIARVLLSESQPTDFLSLQKRVDVLNERLDKLEAASVPHSALRIPQSSHPSQERFNIAEAIADEVFAKLGKETACTFEPNGKPCDHCAMCSSRGF